MPHSAFLGISGAFSCANKNQVDLLGLFNWKLKTPGSDGLPTEFYKVFWNDIADLYLKFINQAYRIGQLSVTQRRGIIKLIQKKKTPNRI